MLDYTIPYKNVIMRLELGHVPDPPQLPQGISLWNFLPGNDSPWAAIETAVGEFKDESEARAYFQETYLPHMERLKRDCFFARDTQGAFLGTCTAWADEKDGAPVGSLSWLAVHPAAQRRGIGSTLIAAVLRRFHERGERTIYLHTQTWSHEAIGLYFRAGFRLLRAETFSRYANDFEEAMPILREVLPQELYEQLAASSQ